MFYLITGPSVACIKVYFERNKVLLSIVKFKIFEVRMQINQPTDATLISSDVVRFFCSPVYLVQAQTVLPHCLFSGENWCERKQRVFKITVVLVSQSKQISNVWILLN